MDQGLDRPAWAALTTRQADMALGDARACRFRPNINLFAAAADRSGAALDALAALVSPGEQAATVEPQPLPPLPGLTLEREAALAQMVATQSPGVEPGFAAAPLGADDAGDMLALATLTQPGPFFSKTWRMGRFIGVREGGRLIAMAGERLALPGFREVTAICTHPDARGRGLAERLTRLVTDRIIGEGDAAFLHAYPHNLGAIRLYERLGFRLRTELVVQFWSRASAFSR